MLHTTKQMSLCLCIATLVLFTTGALEADEIRTWTDSTGKFKIEGKLVSHTDGKVKLERADGRSVEIPFDKLSDQDQKFLNELKENPFKTSEPSSANPFMPAESAKDGAKSGSSPGGATPTAPVSINWNGSQKIDIDSYGDGWEFSVEKSGELDFVPKTVELPVRKEFFEGMKGLAIGPGAQHAAVGYLWTFSTKDRLPRTRLVMCNLQTGRVSGEVEEKVEMVPIALHPDGHQVLMKNAERNNNSLEIWNVQGRNANRGGTWAAHNEEWGRKQDVSWAAFADEKTLILKYGSGWVAIWDFPTLQPRCHFQIEGGCTPALSADGRTLAFYKGERVGLFDVQTHEVIALQKAPRRLNWPNFAFSPSQKLLACVAFDSLLVWNVETGELYRDFEPSGLVINGMPRFSDDEFVLLGNRYLVELENMIKLWDYEGGEQVRAVGGTTFFAVSPQNRPGALMPTLIPHEGAMNALNAALNEPDLFVFRKGATVQLNVSGIPGEKRAQVEADLRKKLAEMDIQIAPSAAVELKASVSGPKTEKMTYTTSGTYTVQIYRTSLELVYEGKSIWQTGGSNIPHFVRINRGTNLGDYLKEKSKSAEYGFFKSVHLPKFVQKPLEGSQGGRSGGQTIGVSKVVPTTSSGPSRRRPVGGRR